MLQSWRAPWHEVLCPPLPQAARSKPSVKQMVWGNLLPLALVTPIMLSVVVRQHPKLFMNILPGDRLYIVGLALFLLQALSVPLMAWTVQNVASMVNIKPTYRDAFVVMLVSASPFWLVSVFYLVPSLAFNILMHGVAAVLSSVLVYFGVGNVFDLQRRGARMMLTITVVSVASLGFGILLISILMFWGQVQELQFSIK